MSAFVDVDAVDAGYGRTRVIEGLSLQVGEGEGVALVGRNGMGKTTTIRTILGLCRATRGTVRVAGRDVTRAAPHRIARLGVGLVPEGRRIFAELTVRENLLATAANYGVLAHPWNLADVTTLFPRLGDRMRQLGSRLSGGEQQMLAIARALLLGPRLLVLDEATEGLAPVVREEIWAALRGLRARGLAVLVVDKYLHALAGVAPRAIVIEKGRVAWTGATLALADDPALHDRYLGV
ncbi:ABC transporter ATP-binding protein [Vulcanimicrobium alpinum]|uniref:ABC transporter ATP-binding protein n=1 Tax=Vulcanimicrobium alpinum TaxID=3016050 RepID=A0AAN1Y0I3_UNVUL|nr:ABC transporter ATP-binding protein [Vulcanimicrobium alpinum]BDE08108.1 ABC transporter ATP-binding protein [Vulcanimicrobium alpinum]